MQIYGRSRGLGRFPLPNARKLLNPGRLYRNKDRRFFYQGLNMMIYIYLKDGFVADILINPPCSSNSGVATVHSQLDTDWDFSDNFQTLRFCCTACASFRSNCFAETQTWVERQRCPRAGSERRANARGAKTAPRTIIVCKICRTQVNNQVSR